ncbi:MAG TPA: hypothetical protein VJI33_05000 [Candidatus Paceibacterota bacterium]
MNPTTIFLLGILTGLLMGYLILALIYAMYASYWDYQIHKLELPVEARPSETFWKYITNPGSKGDEGIIFYIIFFGLAGIFWWEKDNWETTLQIRSEVLQKTNAA